MTQVVIADAQYLTQCGLAVMVTQLDQFSLVGTTTTWENTVAQLSALDEPPLLIIDHVNLEGFSWKGLREILTSMAMNILVVSDENNKMILQTALASGVQGFVTKSCSGSEIKNAILAITKGDRFFCNRIMDLIFTTALTADNDPCAPTQLTQREIEITTLLVDGYNSKAIASQLNLSLHTVYTHRKNIMRKLGVSSVQELVAHALQNGLTVR